MTTNLDEVSTLITDIQKRLIGGLYTVYFSGEDNGVNFEAWGQNEGLEVEASHSLFDAVRATGLIEDATAGPYTTITAQGALFVEKYGLADVELIKQQKSVRTKTLDVLAKIRDEHGPHAFTSWTAIAEHACVSIEDFDRNISVLEAADYIEFVSAGGMQITERGYSAVQHWRDQVQISSRFHVLLDEAQTSVRPQMRGHELEKLLEEVAQHEEWKTERNVRSPGEETDIIFFRDFNYFLVSCKWEKTAIETKDIRDLHYRISSRPSTRGILFSMSGFSQNAINEAARRMESAVLLLFGPNDITNVLEQRERLTDLLNEKLHRAMTRRQIFVDQNAAAVSE